MLEEPLIFEIGSTETTGVDFLRGCNICPHMKRITLPNIHACLAELAHEVRVPEDIAIGARRALARMLEVGRGERT